MGGPGSGKREKVESRRQVTGLLGPVLLTDVPTRVIGVGQRGGPEPVPLACPHCHSSGLMWVRSPWQGHCRACGADFYRTRGEVRFAKHRQRMPQYYDSHQEEA